MQDPKISIVMPVYNEEKTLRNIVDRVLATPYKKELIIVNDCSKDNTADVLKELEALPDVRIFHHETNQGKGAALRTGFSKVEGDIVIIQDADLEYHPEEYGKLLDPILDGRADVVYGSRFLGGPHRVHLFWHYVGNKVLTRFCNILSNLNLTDMETCYKVFKSEVLEGLDIQSNCFGFEPEFTIKIAKRKLRVYEVPISYSGRDYDEGKKITWRDGITAVKTMIHFRFFDK